MTPLAPGPGSDAVTLNAICESVVVELLAGEGMATIGGVVSPGGNIPAILIMRYEPGTLARLTSSVLAETRVTARSTPGTFWLISFAERITAPLTFTVALDTRFVPSKSPFCMCSVYGEVAVAGRENCSRY